MSDANPYTFINVPRHEISNNMVCATSKASDQPAHRRSLIRAFASRLNILWVFLKATDRTSFGVTKLKSRLQRLVWVYTCQNATLLKFTCHGSNLNPLSRSPGSAPAFNIFVSYHGVCFCIFRLIRWLRLLPFFCLVPLLPALNMAAYWSLEGMVAVMAATVMVATVMVAAGVANMADSSEDTIKADLLAADTIGKLWAEWDTLTAAESEVMESSVAVDSLAAVGSLVVVDSLEVVQSLVVPELAE